MKFSSIFRKTRLSIVVATSLGLIACGGDSELSGNTSGGFEEQHIQESLKAPTKVKFNLSGDTSIPLPTFLLVDTTDGTLGIPTDDTALSNPVAAMNTMDGWSVSMPIEITFEGAGLTDEESLKSGVAIAQLSGLLTSQTPPTVTKVLEIDKDFYVDTNADDDRLTITFDDSLDPASNYIFAITNDIKDVNGDPVGMSSSFATLISENPPAITDNLTGAATLTQGIADIFAQLNVDPESIIYGSWFTTQSVGTTLSATKGAIATGINLASNSLGSFNNVWQGSANPNNVDLSQAYLMSVPSTGQDYASALQSDTNFSSYIDSTGQLTQLLLSTYTANSVTVTKGTVKLPYFLEKGSSNWNTTPFGAGMPSLAKVFNVLTGDNSNDAAAITQQLVASDVDVSKLETDITEQLKLVGMTLTLSDGTQLDSERVITQYNPVPQVKSLEDVPFLLFTPTNPTGALELVIYQHGITSSKENAYAIAPNIIKNSNKQIALLVIDQPLHGERSLDTLRSANADATNYLNLTYLPVGRDNLRQSMLDNVGLRAAVTYSQGAMLFTGTPLATLGDTTATHPSLIGHSLGGITAFGTVTTANSTLGSDAADNLFKFSNIAAANTGGQIGSLLIGSATYGDQIRALVTAASPDSDPQEAVEQFTYAAQTVIDPVDPYNLVGLQVAGTNVIEGLPVYMQQVQNDDTVPNSVQSSTGFRNTFGGTEPLASKLGLKSVDSASPTTSGDRNFTKFNSIGQHSSFIAPQNYPTDEPYTIEMHSQLIQFLDGTTAYSVGNSGLLE